MVHVAHSSSAGSEDEDVVHAIKERSTTACNPGLPLKRGKVVSSDSVHVNDIQSCKIEKPVTLTIEVGSNTAD